jgi:hypothetical protein
LWAEKVALVILRKEFCEREPRHQKYAHRQPHAALAPHLPPAVPRPQVHAKQGKEELAFSVQKIS